MSVAHPGRPIKVLSSFRKPRPTTNPYIVMLARALADQPELHTNVFSWKYALVGNYDVLHVHWPEILLDASHPVKKLVRQAAFTALLIRLRARRTPVVRTVHNRAPHERKPWLTRRLLRRLDDQTVAWITLTGEVPPGCPEGSVTHIPHGHYADWYSSYGQEAAAPSTFTFVGLIRQYKNVPLLIERFRHLSPDARLHICGSPYTAQLRRDVIAQASRDNRITLDLRYISDDEFVQAVTRASLVVLPYDDMHSSGVALAALSLGRPVLVPRGEMARDLGTEVGNEWVLEFDPPLRTEHLSGAMGEASSTLARGGKPDLSARDWDRAGDEHLIVYRRALASRPAWRIWRL